MQEGLKVINQIIERDAKTATYKLALLRAVIDIVQNHGNLKKVRRQPSKDVAKKYQSHSFQDFALYPFGLLLEKWMFYYFPLADTVQTTNKSQKLSFQGPLDDLVHYYGGTENFREFYLDYKRGITEPELKKRCFVLARKIRNTIKDQPMCYMGAGYFNGYYRVCFPADDKPAHASQDKLQPLFDPYLMASDYFGWFGIPVQIQEVFEYLGAYILGTSTILEKWTEETLKYARNSTYFNREDIYKKLQPADLERYVKPVREFVDNKIKAHETLHCVLTGKLLKQEKDIAIDHLVPFSVAGNNDLWNLLPAKPSENLKKKDRIPAPSFLEEQRSIITEYWDWYDYELNSRQFEREVAVSLLPEGHKSFEPDKAFEHLKEKCDYLIELRGFEPYGG